MEKIKTESRTRHMRGRSKERVAGRTWLDDQYQHPAFPPGLSGAQSLVFESVSSKRERAIKIKVENYWK